MNPLLNQKNNFSISNELKNLYKLCQNPINANNLLKQYLGNNPYLNALANNGNYESLFKSLCQSKGINPNEYLTSLKRQINE